MAEVIFNKLEKVYSNGFKAVHGIDLKIADGEFMVIVGPSGCAKSTTLRMLAGLETISGGLRPRLTKRRKSLSWKSCWIVCRASSPAARHSAWRLAARL